MKQADKLLAAIKREELERQHVEAEIKVAYRKSNKSSHPGSIANSHSPTS